jgi:hypothetical protein
MIASLAFLIQGLTHHTKPPAALLRSAVVLWITNVLVFALWYWKVDARRPKRARARSRPRRPPRLRERLVSLSADGRLEVSEGNTLQVFAAYPCRQLTVRRL